MWKPRPRVAKSFAQGHAAGRGRPALDAGGAAPGPGPSPSFLHCFSCPGACPITAPSAPSSRDTGSRLPTGDLCPFLSRPLVCDPRLPLCSRCSVLPLLCAPTASVLPLFPAALAPSQSAWREPTQSLLQLLGASSVGTQELPSTGLHCSNPFVFLSPPEKQLPKAGVLITSKPRAQHISVPAIWGGEAPHLQSSPCPNPESPKAGPMPVFKSGSSLWTNITSSPIPASHSHPRTRAKDHRERIEAPSRRPRDGLEVAPSLPGIDTE